MVTSRLEKAVASFTDSVRPVCLATPDFIDFPPCTDASVVHTHFVNKGGI